MKKVFKVKLTFADNTEEVFEFETENVEKTLLEFAKVKPLKKYEILEEEQKISTKKILFG